MGGGVKGIVRWCASVVLVLVASGLAAIAFAAGVAAQPSQFITRSGTQLRLGAAAWRFVGFDEDQLTSTPGGYTCGAPLGTPALDAVMQQAAAAGARVVRTWFFQSFYDLGASGAPSFAAFDRVLAAATQYGLKVVPVLVNEYPQCEPGTAAKSLSFFTGGYTRPGYGYPLSFKAYAAAVAADYSGDPTIAFWEIGNDLSAGTASCSGSVETAAAHSLRAFADAMTTTIKAADPNHLVALGTLGTGQCGLAGRDYGYVTGGAVDLCEYQDYGDVPQPLPSELAERIAECRALRKPMFVGASGIGADVGDNGRPTGTISTATEDLRAGFFDAKLTATFRAGAAGYVIWDLGPDASNSLYNLPTGGFEIGPGDPTLTVTARLVRSFGAYPGPVRSMFEDGRTDRWIAVHNAGQPTVANSTEEAWGGTHSLAISLSGARAEAIKLPAPPGLGSGSVLTLHVFVPATSPPGVAAEPFAIRRDRTTVSAVPAIMAPGWNVITWRLPGGLRPPLAALGLTVNQAARWHGTVYLDDVAWSNSR
jgi:mannan endo-1,4-beta-mannosidase